MGQPIRRGGRLAAAQALLLLCALLSLRCGGGGGGSGDNLSADAGGLHTDASMADAALDAAGRGDAATDAPGRGDVAPLPSVISGVVQKGPFVVGSSITVQELDATLAPTGKTFDVTTKDDEGNFDVPVNVSSQYVEVIAAGYYFDELTNHLSPGQLTLRAVVNLTSGATVDVNLLTSMSEPLVRNLVSQGKSFADAQSQAESSVLGALGFSGSLGASVTTVSLTGSTATSAEVLAASLIVEQYAASLGSSEVAQLSQLLGEIGVATADGGGGNATLEALHAALCATIWSIDPAAVRANLTGYYGSLGASASIPPFEQYLCGCGIMCGTTCVNQMTDVRNCGACGTKCPVGGSCQGGSCACATGAAVSNGVCCAMGDTACGGVCVNEQTDLGNCGACGMKCGARETCDGGACSCPSGQVTDGGCCAVGETACNGACVDTSSDPANCGSCANGCTTTGERCTRGSCSCPGTLASSGAIDGGKASDGGAACVLGTPADSGAPGSLAWADDFAGGPMASTVGGPQPTRIAVDPSNGDVVVTGYLTAPADFGGGFVGFPYDGSANQPGQAFVAKYDASGVYKWAKVYEPSPPFFDVFLNGPAAAPTVYAGVEGYGIAVDTCGDIALGGMFTGTIDFGCGPMAATADDIFLAKLDSSGTCIWSKHFGAAQQFQQLNALFIDHFGDWLVAGEGTGLIFGDGGDAATDGGSSTGWFIAKLDSKGNALWSRQFAVDCDEVSGPTFAVDPAGNSLLGGCYTKTVDFGCGTLTPAGSNYTGFVAKLDPSGACVWSKRYNNDSLVESIASDPCGNVLLAGSFAGILDLGSGSLSSGYVFVGKVDASGNGVWSTSYGNSGSSIYRMAVDTLGEPVLFGFGDLPPACSTGSANTFVAKLNSSGTGCEWGYNGTSWSALPIAADSSNDTLLAGRFGGTLGIAGSTLSSSISGGVQTDGFLVKIGP